MVDRNKSELYLNKVISKISLQIEDISVQCEHKTLDPKNKTRFFSDFKIFNCYKYCILNMGCFGYFC